LLLAPLEELVGREATPVLRVTWDDIGEVLDILLGMSAVLVVAFPIEDVVFQ
jgi:hypothetical protein